MNSDDEMFPTVESDDEEEEEEEKSQKKKKKTKKSKQTSSKAQVINLEDSEEEEEEEEEAATPISPSKNPKRKVKPIPVTVDDETQDSEMKVEEGLYCSLFLLCDGF